LDCKIDKRFRDVLVELDDQDRFARFRFQFEQVARSLKLKLTFGLIEQRPIDVFDRGRLEIEKLNRRLPLLQLPKRKKIRPKAFLVGRGEILSSAEKMAASVPSLPARIWVRSFGTRRNRSMP